MSWMDKMKKIFKDSQLVSILTPLPNVEHIPRNYSAYLREYLRNPYLHTAVNLIARTVSSLEVILYDGKTEIENSPYLDLIHKPNPFETKTIFLQSVVRMLMLTGNAFIEVVRVGDKPREMYVLRSDRISIRPGMHFGEVQAYVYSVGAQKLEFAPEDIIHIYISRTIDDYFGDTPLDACAYSIDMNDAAREWNTSLLQNGARPMGALIAPMDLTEDQIRMLREQFETHYTGAKKAGKPLVLQGGLDWKEIGLSPSEMSWETAIKLSAREVAIVFGIPPELLGEPEYKTYSNYQEARRQFFINTVIPIAEQIVESLSRLLPQGFKFKIDYDEIEALQEDRNVVWEQVLNAVLKGILTINEARERLGYSRIQGADNLLVNASLIPLGSGFEEEI